MNYRVISYLETYEDRFTPIPDSKVRYKLQKKVCFLFWVTLSSNDNRDVLDKQAAELNAK